MKFFIHKLPISLEDFSAILPEINEKPEGAVAACVLALYLAALGDSIASDVLRAMNAEISLGSIVLAEGQLRSKPYLIRSYFKGRHRKTVIPCRKSWRSNSPQTSTVEAKTRERSNSSLPAQVQTARDRLL